MLHLNVALLGGTMEHELISTCIGRECVIHFHGNPGCGCLLGINRILANKS